MTAGRVASHKSLALLYLHTRSTEHYRPSSVKTTVVHGRQAHLVMWGVLRRVLSHDVPDLLPSQAFRFQNGKGSLS